MGNPITNGRDALDVRQWAQALACGSGARYEASWGRSGSAITVQINAVGVNLIYRHGGDNGQDMDYPVMVDWTPCNYGGRRAWWLCPCCGRRVAIIYSGGAVFACRKCERLTYQSTRTAPGSKPFERADKLRKRLGWCAGVANPLGDKPKGMRWATYRRHLEELRSHAIEAMQRADRLVTRLNRKTDKPVGRLPKLPRD